jgi:hypothetical protein
MATRTARPDRAQRTDSQEDGATTSPRTPKPRGPGHLWKRLVLGPALPTSHLQHERLGKPTALAVFASDNLS